jgi:Ser/Thr protein kinase RdoA (MazF antagonist)
MTRDLLRIQRTIYEPDSLATLVKAYYGFDRVFCQLLKPMMADTYSIWADNTQYLLRIFRHRQYTHRQIKDQMQMLTYLDEMGIPVTAPVPKRSGEMLTHFQAPEGERYGVLFRYLPGKPLNQQLTPDHAYKYGEILAQLHATLDKLTILYDRPPLNADTLLRDPIRNLKGSGLLAHRARDLGYLHRISSVLRTRIANLTYQKPDFGMIHGDVDPSNAIIMADGRIGLIDFDMSGEGHRIYDLAAFQAEANFRGAPEVLTEKFIEGYQSLRKLSRDERQALPIYRAARVIWSLGLYATNVNEWGSYRITDNFIDRQFDDIRAAMMEFQLSE